MWDCAVRPFRGPLGLENASSALLKSVADFTLGLRNPEFPEVGFTSQGPGDPSILPCFLLVLPNKLFSKMGPSSLISVQTGILPSHGVCKAIRRVLYVSLWLLSWKQQR